MCTDVRAVASLLNLQNAIDGKMKQAQDWLVDPEALVGSAG